jgi:hypothetical protein
MKPTDIAVWIARLLFGAIGLLACLMLLFGIFIFDAPGSTNVWSVNLAAAPLVYLVTYALSCSSPTGINGQAPANRARLVRAFMPLIGIVWYGLAWFAIEKVCHGNFTC